MRVWKIVEVKEDPYCVSFFVFFCSKFSAGVGCLLIYQRRQPPLQHWIEGLHGTMAYLLKVGFIMLVWSHWYSNRTYCWQLASVFKQFNETSWQLNIMSWKLIPWELRRTRGREMYYVNIRSLKLSNKEKRQKSQAYERISRIQGNGIGGCGSFYTEM